MPRWNMADNAPASAPLELEQLRNLGLFGALPEATLERLARELAVRSCSAGDVIFREGEEARAMFVLLHGEMEVLKQSRRGGDARVALLGPGDWFGEMGIVDVQRRSATVRALAPSRLIELTAADLDRIYRSDLKAYSLIVLNLARELSRRLRVADGIVADLIVNVLDGYLHPATRPPPRV